MLSLIHGRLAALSGDTVALALDLAPTAALTYEVLVSPYTGGRLGQSIGQVIDLHTLQYLDSPNQGATFIPRLAGFLDRTDLEFYELLTTVKGIGFRRALRLMALSSEQIAAAIADRDTSLLQSLPEVGKRTAETIVLALKEKVEPFLSGPAMPAAAGGSAVAPPPSGRSTAAREALHVLVSLGENRAQALAWIEQALRDVADPAAAEVQDLLTRVYRLKER